MAGLTGVIIRLKGFLDLRHWDIQAIDDGFSDL
jgi:hypothetical protein